MKIKYYFKRIINNKIKLGLILLIFAYPITDIYFTLKDINLGGSVPEPNMASFLTSFIYSGAQMLLLWYLPLYFLLIAADNCIEDFKLGYKSILVTRWGKKKYFAVNILKGFIIGFFVILLSLVLNLVMTQIVYKGGSYTGLDSNDQLGKEILKHPLLTNITYIFVTSFITGIVSMGAVAMAIALHNRYLVYPIVFLLWYIPVSFDKSIILALQSFTEYSLLDVLPTILIVIGINIATVIFAYIKEMKYEQVT